MSSAHAKDVLQMSKNWLDIILGVRFNFKYYSQRKDHSTGQVRDFKIYEADEFQITPELERLAKTKSGRQRQVRYNPNWQYLKEKTKEVLNLSSLTVFFFFSIFICT